MLQPRSALRACRFIYFCTTEEIEFHAPQAAAAGKNNDEALLPPREADNRSSICSALAREVFLCECRVAMVPLVVLAMEGVALVRTLLGRPSED